MLKQDSELLDRLVTTTPSQGKSQGKLLFRRRDMETCVTVQQGNRSDLDAVVKAIKINS